MCGDKKISKHIVEIHLVNGLGDYLQYTGIYCIYTVGLWEKFHNKTMKSFHFFLPYSNISLLAFHIYVIQLSENGLALWMIEVLYYCNVKRTPCA